MNIKLLNQCFLLDEAKTRLEEIKGVRTRLLEALTKAPMGAIHIANSSGRVQYYLRTTSKEKTGEYIPKSEKGKIKTYLQKAYNKKVIKVLDKEIAVLEKFIHSFTGLEKTIQNTYESYPESSKAYIQPINVSDDSFTQMWMQIPYERKMISEEYTTFLTNNGERVRSKSELTIANALYKRKIPYKYECPLRLDKYSVIYPDFTILNSRTRKVIYWEHRGMMDDRDYARHAVKRMKDYQSAGICIGKDLIITEETVNYPLGTNEIDWIIDNYLV